MDDAYLYQQIAEAVRREILDGRLKPGDRLLPVREMSERWKCTAGTVQRAYRLLSQEGLLVSRAGRGTCVSGMISTTLFQDDGKIRRANLVHRSEAYLLEVLTAGYNLHEIQQALDIAMDRWRVLESSQEPVASGTVRFVGSHDMVMNGLARHYFEKVVQGVDLSLSYSGSLGGLLALAEGRADIAGCHLWDAETNRYNLPFVRKLFPGKEMLLVTLAHRRQGLMTAPGNPLNIHSLKDLTRPEVRFINRQMGSGTRVWLDETMARLGFETSRVNGYEIERVTHSDIANAVSEGQADAGLGLESAARDFNLEFVFLIRERYDLVMLPKTAARPHVRALIDWLGSPTGKEYISRFCGYDCEESGRIRSTAAVHGDL